MNKLNKHSNYIGYLQALACGTALACVLGTVGLPSSAYTQNIGSLTTSNSANNNAPMLLSADEMVMDRDQHTVTARGNVQIEYNGNRIVAREVTYNQQTKRVMGRGNVEIVDAKGVKVYAQEVDLTDDLGEGFVNSLRAETADNTRFAAESAERSGGQMTVFNNGAYTACEPCYQKPDSEVLWQVKARKIIWNGTTKTMRFEDSRFEVYGVPIAWFPVFEMADPSVKRKSGFLSPSFIYKDNLGFGVSSGYFWNLAPNYDFTLSTTGYSKQGALVSGEWRHRLENGSYDIRLNYINQLNRDDFDSWSIDKRQTNRYSLTTKGDFNINPRWNFGWDILAQSDRNFSRTYGISDYNSEVNRSQIYLTGLNKRNYFDMRFYHFDVQEDLLKSNSSERNTKQPWVLPRIDYSFIPDEAVFGGELKVTSNFQSLYRENADYAFADWNGNALDRARLAGINGTSTRLTGELEWKRDFISEQGLVITPLFALRGDGFVISPDDNYSKALSSSLDYSKFDIKDNALRGMATAGLEVRYPILISAGSSTHIIEPTAQIYARNNEQYAGRLTNEDAQSFVFDATTLFERDKFSGYDRVEGGTRANLGVRYSGNFDNNWSLYGLAGQSFQLGGINSFDSSDLVSVGSASGLETARSDYVAMLGLSDGAGLSLATRGRFDERTLQVRRGEIDLRKQWSSLSLGTQYAYIERQANYGYSDDRQEVSVNGSVKIINNWNISANTSYDIVSETVVRAGTAINYQDECFGILFGYSQTRNPGETASSHNWNFMLSFRTIGDFGSGTAR
ncbi:LPS-assembly protein LptD [Bartonella sp. HY406]|uniref:LPS-assembly protein LptD n=1 Tax=Bartonella sp. HY406 TaxID=2979331 RepID=UPI0021C880BA|nr:LPS-assembly protein LptD [Bartonella sp. HY406]UXN04652.1 LPS-assembly protein LptD [Bartonella sp. HY406]